MPVIGILTGDPELENYVSKIGKRNPYLKNWTARLNDAVVRYLNHKSNGSMYVYMKITPDMVDETLFKKVDFLFYNFMDPVAAKIVSEELYENIMKVITKNPSKVYPPPKFAKLIADKCEYYKYLQKKKIPVVPFFCVTNKEYKDGIKGENHVRKAYIRNLYGHIQSMKWKGFIAKPTLGTSSRGFHMYPDESNVSVYEIYKQMDKQMNKVFNVYKFPKLLFQERHSEFGEGRKPEMKLYYLGTRFLYGWITYGKTYYQLGKAPENSAFYLSKQNVTEAKRFAQRALKAIKPLFGKYPLLITRVDIGCCLDHSNGAYQAKNLFLNEIEYGPAYVLARLPGKYKKYIDIKIAEQIKHIVQTSVNK